MQIGLLADSHGHADTTAAAVKALRDRGAETLIHLGDVGTTRVLETLTALPAHVVFGNCDLAVDQLTRDAQRLGITVDHPVGTLTIDGKVIVFTHGHLEEPMKQAIEDAAAYLLHGHTHVARDDRFGATRIINPGALHRAARYTAALLNPARDSLELLEIPRPI